MCLKCKVKECPPDFGETLVEILEPDDLKDCPHFLGHAVLAWLSQLEHTMPECMSCTASFAPDKGAAALVCVVPPTARHVFITGVCGDCFPVVDCAELVIHVDQVNAAPRAMRRRYN